MRGGRGGGGGGMGGGRGGEGGGMGGGRGRGGGGMGGGRGGGGGERRKRRRRRRQRSIGRRGVSVSVCSPTLPLLLLQWITVVYPKSILHTTSKAPCMEQTVTSTPSFPCHQYHRLDCSASLASTPHMNCLCITHRSIVLHHTDMYTMSQRSIDTSVM